MPARPSMPSHGSLTGRVSGSVTGIVTGIIGLQIALSGCSVKPKTDPAKATAVRALAKRNQAACGSQVAYDRLKNLAIDEAIGARNGDHAGLDTLADYSLARMERPIVKSHDDALDLTECEGRLVLELPPGAERGFGGQRQLAADVGYTAQAAADGNGYVYALKGAGGIVEKLAGFQLKPGSFLLPAAMDNTQFAAASAPPAPSTAQSGPQFGQQPRQQVDPAPRFAPVPDARPQPRIAAAQPPQFRVPGPDRRATPPSYRRPSWQQPEPEPEYRDDRWQDRPAPETDEGDDADQAPSRGAGAATVRDFYRALGSGNGSAASGLVVPEKRAARPYSPQGIARFYGRLPEPLRLTAIEQVSPNAYRVAYAYSAGRTRCNGRAVVTTTNRGSTTYIRGIRALSGC